MHVARIQPSFSFLEGWSRVHPPREVRISNPNYLINGGRNACIAPSPSLGMTNLHQGAHDFNC